MTNKLGEGLRPPTSEPFEIPGDMMAGLVVGRAAVAQIEGEVPPEDRIYPSMQEFRWYDERTGLWYTRHIGDMIEFEHLRRGDARAEPILKLAAWGLIGNMPEVNYLMEQHGQDFRSAQNVSFPFGEGNHYAGSARILRKPALGSPKVEVIVQGVNSIKRQGSDTLQGKYAIVLPRPNLNGSAQG